MESKKFLYEQSENQSTLYIVNHRTPSAAFG